MYSRSHESGPGFSPEDVLGIVWKRIWVVALVAVVFAGSGVGFGFLHTPEYEANAKMLVGQKPTEEDRVTSLGSDIMGLQQATQTVAVAVGSKPVSEAVVDELGLSEDPQELLESLSVQQVEATQFVELTYTSTDPGEARQVVNAFGEAASERIAESSSGASGLQATVWEYASAPQAPSGLSLAQIGIIALGLGLMLGIGLTFLLEYLDDGWTSAEEVEGISGVPNFGVVPDFAAARKG